MIGDRMAQLQKAWMPPAELSGSTPREVRLAGGGVAAVIFTAVLFAGAVAVFIGMSVVGERRRADQRLLHLEGRETEARITRLWRDRNKERQPRVAYEFEAAGTLYEGEVRAPLVTWKTLAEGGRLAIRYLPARPELNHPVDWESSTFPMWLPYVLSLGFAILGGVLIVMLRRTRSLLSEGRPAPAIVTRFTRTQHGGKIIHYEFPLLTGSMTKGRAGPVSRSPGIGDIICVVYDRENPRRSIPYPSRLMRVSRASSWR